MKRKREELRDLTSFGKEGAEILTFIFFYNDNGAIVMPLFICLTMSVKQ